MNLQDLKFAVHMDTSDVERGAKSVEGSVGGLKSHMGGMIATAGGFAIAMAGMAVASGGFDMLKESVIGMNAKLETSTLQFTTLMGNAGQAKAHVKDLFEFAKVTPFETQPIIDASRIMHTFGGNALDTMGNLKLFGDAAAATNAPINEVAFWMSRAYAMIQAGKPIGEATMRLGELGVIAPQTAMKIEDLQKKGAKSSEVWNTLSGDLKRFGGAMEAQAGTWSGLTSTLSDAINITLAGAFEPFFRRAKDGVSGLITIFGSEGFQKTMADVANVAMDVFGVVGQLIGGTFQVIGAILGPIVEMIGNFVTIVKAGADPLMAFGEALTGNEIAGTAFGDALGGISHIIGDVVTFIQNAVAELTSFGDSLGQLSTPGDYFVAILGRLLGMFGVAGDTIEPLAASFDRLSHIIGDMLVFYLQMLGLLWDEVIRPGIAMLQEKVAELAVQFSDLVPHLIKVIEVFTQITKAVLPVVIHILSVLLPVALTVVVAAIKIVIDVIRGFADFIVNAFTLIKDLVTGNWGALWDDVKRLVGDLVGAIFRIIGDFVEGIVKFFHTLWDKLTGHSIIPDMIADIVRWFAGMPGRIMGAVGDLAGLLVGKAIALVGGFLSGAVQKHGELISWLGGLGGRVLSAIGDLGRTLWNAGINLLQGFLNGLLQKWKDVKEFVGGIANWVKDHKGPAAEDLALLMPAGKAMMTGLQEGLRAGYGDVQQLVTGMSGQLASSFDVSSNVFAGGHLTLALSVNIDGETVVRKIMPVAIDEIRRKTGTRL